MGPSRAPCRPRLGAVPHSLSVDDSVGVEHGHDLEDVGLPQAGRERAGAHQELQRALHDPAGVGLPGVHPRREEDERTIPLGVRAQGENQGKIE